MVLVWIYSGINPSWQKSWEGKGKKKKKAKEIAREKRDKVEVRKEKERKKCRRQPTTTKVVGEIWVRL